MTVTVTPDAGYELSELIVKDDATNPITTMKVSDTVYTFTMPAANANVDATFKKKVEDPTPPTPPTPSKPPVRVAVLDFLNEDGTLFTKRVGIIGEMIRIPLGPTKAGFEFDYWQGSQYEPGDLYLVTGPHTFTAVFQPIGQTALGDEDVNTEEPADAQAPEADAPEEMDIAPAPEEAEAPADRGAAPKTGDATIAIYGAMMALAWVGMAESKKRK